MFDAGLLRHRLKIQRLEYVTDSSGEVQDSNGDPVQEWVDVAEVWGAIQPLSAREFITAQAEQSEIQGKIVIRYRDDLDASMRILHEYKGVYYNLEGLLTDRESGLEYITIPVGAGVRYTEAES